MYRLKKDLPFAKAGTILDPNTIIDMTEYGGSKSIKIDGYECQIPTDVDPSDWVEKVKPRIFRLVLDSAGNPFAIAKEGSAYPKGCKTIMVEEI